MKLKDLTEQDIDAMSYDDLALMILTEKNKKMKINDLFKEVSKLARLSEEEYIEKLPAFFDVLSTDHRFIMLENGLWDLKTKHSTKVVIDPEDEEDIEEDIDIEESEEEIEEEKDENIYADDDEDDLTDDDDDDLKDLVIIDEDEEQMV
jgi:DNA-directed RNA polymerase delta subunit